MGWVARLFNRFRRKRILKLSEHDVAVLLRENSESLVRHEFRTETNASSVQPMTVNNMNPTGANHRGINPGIVNGGSGGFETDAINQRYKDSAFEESHLHDSN